RGRGHAQVGDRAGGAYGVGARQSTTAGAVGVSVTVPDLLNSGLPGVKSRRSKKPRRRAVPGWRWRESWVSAEASQAGRAALLASGPSRPKAGGVGVGDRVAPRPRGSSARAQDHGRGTAGALGRSPRELLDRCEKPVDCLLACARRGYGHAQPALAV